MPARRRAIASYAAAIRAPSSRSDFATVARRFALDAALDEFGHEARVADRFSLSLDVE